MNYFLIFHYIFILIFIFILFLEIMMIILICLMHVQFFSGLFFIIVVSQLVTSILIIIFIRFLLISWHLERILLFSIIFCSHHPHPHFHYICIRLIFYSLQFCLHHHHLSHYYLLLTFSQLILGPVIMFLHPSTTQQVRVWFFHLKSVRCRRRICKVE